MKSKSIAAFSFVASFLVGCYPEETTPTATGGTSATGGSSTGGASGGTATGGKATGGVATGGTVTATGGQASGGTSTGGTATGGKASGGTATGGATGTGGSGGCTPPKAGSKGTNPLFTDVYTADPGALVYNCTFYINCGHDEGGGSGFVMNNWFILKSTDMVNWTRINNALTLSAFKWANANAWAGQMITKGGKFYWFVPVNKIGSCPNNCGMAIGVAVGDSPEGPFTDYLGKPLIDDLLEMSNWNLTLDSDSPYTIDPTAFVDDDGQAYLMYGGFGRLVGAKLTLNGNSVSLNGGLSYVSGASGFFEAAYLTKRNGTYYVVYAAGSNPATIDYATASAPLGPYTRRGRILNSLPTNSTDAATSHPAVAEFAGQWYLVYHVSNGPNGGGTYHRMVAVDKMNFNSDGTIPLITPSSGLQF
jgi:beta-xylosidase